MRDIVYEHQASAALDTARHLFKRTDDVIRSLEWTLARDDSAGLPVAGGALRLLVFDQARSVGMPQVECLFEFRPHQIIIHDLEFS